MFHVGTRTLTAAGYGILCADTATLSSVPIPKHWRRTCILSETELPMPQNAHLCAPRSALAEEVRLMQIGGSGALASAGGGDKWLPCWAGAALLAVPVSRFGTGSVDGLRTCRSGEDARFPLG
jgi:hypothetical protein